MNDKSIEIVMKPIAQSVDNVFVEIEYQGKSVKLGTWGTRPDGYTVITITQEQLNKLFAS